MNKCWSKYILFIVMFDQSTHFAHDFPAIEHDFVPFAEAIFGCFFSFQVCDKRQNHINRNLSQFWLHPVNKDIGKYWLRSWILRKTKKMKMAMAIIAMPAPITIPTIWERKQKMCDRKFKRQNEASLCWMKAHLTMLICSSTNDLMSWQKQRHQNHQKFR